MSGTLNQAAKEDDGAQSMVISNDGADEQGGASKQVNFDNKPYEPSSVQQDACPNEITGESSRSGAWESGYDAWGCPDEKNGESSRSGAQGSGSIYWG